MLKFALAVTRMALACLVNRVVFTTGANKTLQTVVANDKTSTGHGDLSLPGYL